MNGYKSIYAGINKAPDMALGHPNYQFATTVKQVNPERYGAEFNTYDENSWVTGDPGPYPGIVQNINALDSDGAYFIGYDIEGPNSPDAEVGTTAKAVTSVTAAHNLTSSHGMKLWSAPGSPRDTVNDATQLAPHIDIYIIQGEGKRQLTVAQQQQQNPGGANIFTTTTGYRDFVNNRAAAVRSANPSAIVIAELSTSPGGLTTDLAGMQAAWNSVKANVDGATCWPGIQSGGDPLLRDFLAWFGTTDQRFAGGGGGGTKIIQSFKSILGTIRTSSSGAPINAYVAIYRPLLKYAADMNMGYPDYTQATSQKLIACSRGAQFKAYNTANYSPTQTVPDILGNAASMAADGCDFIGYALNSANSPATENSNRSTYVTNAATQAHNNGLKLLIAPGALDTAGVDALAPLLSANDIFVIVAETQIPDGTTSTNISTFKNFVTPLAQEIATQNYQVQIIVQMSTIPNAGTTTLDMLQRCWKSVFNVVDGFTIWSNNSSTGDPLLRRFISWASRCAREN